MFLGPCFIAIVDEWKNNLLTLAILFHLLCAQHVSDVNISIIRNLRLCWWITTSVVLFSVRCVLELLVRAVFGGVRFEGWSLNFRLKLGPGKKSHWMTPCYHLTGITDSPLSSSVHLLVISLPSPSPSLDKNAGTDNSRQGHLSTYKIGCKEEWGKLLSAIMLAFRGIFPWLQYEWVGNLMS